MKDYEEFRNSKIIKNAEIEMKKCKHPYVGTEHLLLALLKEEEISNICSKYNLFYDKFKKELLNVVGQGSEESPFILHTPLLKMIVNEALIDAEERDCEVTLTSLLISLLENGDGIAMRILVSMNINIDKLYKDLKKREKFWKSEGSFGVNLNESVDLEERVVGREKEIKEIIEILLRKNKNNPLLLGQAGVGKTAIVEELARRIKLGNVPSKLKNMTIISLDISSVVAGTKYRGEFEEKLKNIIDTVIENENIILFVDEIHSIVHAGGSEGAVDAANILKPYLSRGKIKLIGATTIGEYNKFIKKDKALERRFQVVNILEPTLEETMEIVEKCKSSYENFYNIKINKNNVRDLVTLVDRFVKHKKNPDKTLEILDSLCSKLRINSCNEEKIKIKKSDILEKIEEVYSVSLEKKYDYEKLHSCLKKSLVGQEGVYEKILNVLKNKQDKPVSMLFCGSSGVGKTKSVSIISECLGLNLIKLDMSEYMNETSINKLIGVSQGYAGYDDEFILDKVRFNPNSIILLDEVEKGSKKVLNLFLNILDEGFINDAKGEIIDFSNCIIVLTSNLKQENSIGFFRKNNNNHFFSNEFLARLDEIIYFNDISEDMIKEYLHRCNSNVLASDVISNCDYKRLGFRAINKYIRNNERKAKVN